MDAQGMSQMYEVGLSNGNTLLENTVQNVSSMGGSANTQSSSLGYASIGHADGSLSMWNLQMRQCVQSVQMHSQQVRGVSYSTDGNYVASASYDGSI